MEIHALMAAVDIAHIFLFDDSDNEENNKSNEKDDYFLQVTVPQGSEFLEKPTYFILMKFNVKNYLHSKLFTIYGIYITTKYHKKKKKSRDNLHAPKA